MHLCIYLVWALYAQTSPVKLSGEIEGLNGAEVALLNADRNEVVRVKGKGNKFSMRADVVKGDGRVYYLYVPSLGKLGPAMNIPYFYFFIDNDALEVKAEIKDKNLKRVSVKNSAAMDEYDACTGVILIKIRYRRSAHFTMKLSIHIIRYRKPKRIWLN